MNVSLTSFKFFIFFIIFETFLCFFIFSSHALAAFTITEEKKLGKEIYTKLDAKGQINKDSQINDYVTKLGNRLLSHIKTSPFEYTFSVINDAGINAFATPGGYVYVNSGLIRLAKNEGQLAGTLAHEIGHVQARHIAKMIEQSKKINLATLAAIIAGAFLGGGGEGTAAVTTFSVAAATSINLKYSRDHEEEADRLGMEYLVKAGYDGMCMIEFLKIMRQYEYYSSSVPSYFLTHPGTDERIRYLYGLQQTKYKNGGNTEKLTSFDRVKTKLVLTDTDSSSSLKHFQNILKDYPQDINALYGLAVTHEKLGQMAEAFRYYEEALSHAPNDYDVLRDMGFCLFKAGSHEQALKILENAYRLNNSDVQTILYLGRLHETLGNYQKALDFYQLFQEQNPEDVENLYNLAMAYGKNNDPGKSHFTFGTFFMKKNKTDSALFHFKAALNHFPKDSEYRKKIEENIEKLKR